MLSSRLIRVVCSSSRFSPNLCSLLRSTLHINCVNRISTILTIFMKPTSGWSRTKWTSYEPSDWFDISSSPMTWKIMQHLTVIPMEMFSYVVMQTWRHALFDLLIIGLLNYIKHGPRHQAPFFMSISQFSNLIRPWSRKFQRITIYCRLAPAHSLSHQGNFRSIGSTQVWSIFWD